MSASDPVSKPRSRCSTSSLSDPNKQANTNSRYMNQSAPTAQSTRQAVVDAESFRLLELPFDLLELLTLFFRRDEAVQLLTVSGGFHNLFAQSVWREVTKKTLAVAEPTRSAAYARYGRLVRTINLLFDTDAGYELHDWLALFPNIASLRTSSAMLPEQAQMLLAAITGLHGLGSVWIRFTNEARSLSLSDVADALLARHQNRAIRRLQLLNITIHDTDHATPWTTMSDFVQAIEPLNTVGLGIEMSAFRGHEIPTEEQMSLLRPYLIEVSDHDYGRATFDCVVPWNSSVFGQLNNQAVVYPNTNKLVLNICCTSELLDYCSIAPAMFPNLQALSLFTKSCEHAEPIDHEPVLVSILSHHWPHVIEFGVGTKVFGGCLDALVENNQQLTTLQVCGVMGPDNETASLDQVLFGLPHLLDLLISAPYIGTLSANWTEDNLTDIRNCPLESLVVGTDEITVSAMELILLLPRLKTLDLGPCSPVEATSALALLTSGEHPAHGAYGQNIEWLAISFDKGWSLELLSALIGILPQLRVFRYTIFRQATINSLKQSHPHIQFVKY